MKPIPLAALLFLVPAGIQAGAASSAGTAKITRPDPPAAIVVELFTSQGCSSCPPADALLSELAARGEVIALAFHVDYWDRLGWKDPFARNEWTQRQRAYARAFETSRIYTPQAIVDGRRDVVGSHRDALAHAVREQRARKDRATVTATARFEEAALVLDARVRLGVPASSPLTIHAAVVETGLETRIPRGENGGRTLRNDAVVRSLTALGQMAPGATTASAEARVLPVDPSWKRERLQVVVFAQDPHSMAIAGGAAATPAP